MNDHIMNITQFIIRSGFERSRGVEYVDAVVFMIVIDDIGKLVLDNDLINHAANLNFTHGMY